MTNFPPSQDTSAEAQFPAVAERLLPPRRRDPFTWILTGMAICLFLALPLVVIAVFSGIPRATGAVLVLVGACMAFLTLSAAFVAFRVSLQRRIAKFSLRDLCIVSFIACSSFGVLTIQDAVLQILAFTAVGLLITILLAIRWTGPKGEDCWLDYACRLVGNGLAIGILMPLFIMLVAAFAMTFAFGLGR